MIGDATYDCVSSRSLVRAALVTYCELRSIAHSCRLSSFLGIDVIEMDWSGYLA